MALIAQPPNTNIDPKIGIGWTEFFSNVFFLLGCLTQSGPTSERPVKMLFAGRPYFDTSLGANGRPIWVNKTGTGWVYADGTAA